MFVRLGLEPDAFGGKSLILIFGFGLALNMSPSDAGAVVDVVVLDCSTLVELARELVASAVSLSGISSRCF